MAGARPCSCLHGRRGIGSELPPCSMAAGPSPLLFPLGRAQELPRPTSARSMSMASPPSALPVLCALLARAGVLHGRAPCPPGHWVAGGRTLLLQDRRLFSPCVFFHAHLQAAGPCSIWISRHMLLHQCHGEICQQSNARPRLGPWVRTSELTCRFSHGSCNV
jgi:hypothetical protein|uniref:Uncharacterized protein n=1 Tax=Zea mays TaxID=4577 RepID=B4FCY4_MAIZE|nr:unknown [Zea mays]|eukprot:NP_001131535.1 uncharacterized protein LOC100192875 [Zea mays]